MRRRSTLLAATFAAVSVLASTGTALADQWTGGVIQQFGVCVGEPTIENATLSISRSIGGTPYPNDATLTLSVEAILPPSNVTVAITVTDPTIVLPSDWTSQPEFTLSSDTFGYQATYTGTSVGFSPGQIEWRLSVNGAPPVSEFSALIVGTEICTPTPTPTATATATATATPTPTPSPSPTPLPTGTAAPTATADPTGSVAPTSTSVPSMPDTAATVEPAPPPSGGGSIVVVLAVLVGIAGATALLTVRRSRR